MLCILTKSTHGIFDNLQAGGDPDAADAAELGDLTGGEVNEVVEEEDAACGQSFTASTKVLLASGAAIPIAPSRCGS
jgi:hypothetical protein